VPHDVNAPCDAASQDQPQETQKAAGHTEVKPQEQVVTAANSKVRSATAVVNAPRVRIDYAALRRQVTLQQVLEHLGYLSRLTGSGTQRRGPCPIHAQADNRERTFSVALDKHVSRCFHAECRVQGNVLDFWAAIHRLPLYDAALNLAQTFSLELTPIREEEPVSRALDSASIVPKSNGVITPDAC